MGVLRYDQIFSVKIATLPLSCWLVEVVCLFLQHEPERGAQAVRQECRSSHQGPAELLPVAASVSEADEETRHLAC